LEKRPETNFAGKKKDKQYLEDMRVPIRGKWSKIRSTSSRQEEQREGALRTEE